MAATKRNAMLIEEARNKIRTTQLINRLQNHVDGTVELSATQVSAAKILLGKSLPDIASIQLTGDRENPIAVSDVSLDNLTREQRCSLRAIVGTIAGQPQEDVAPPQLH